METIYKIFEFRVWFLQAAGVAVLAFIAWKIILHPICGAIYEWHEERAKKRRIKKYQEINRRLRLEDDRRRFQAAMKNNRIVK